jgi:uncharacterized protein YqeY
VAGLGASEVERRPVDVRAVVAAEVEHRRAAAREYVDLGRPDRAERLHAEADVLVAHLRSRGGATTGLRSTGPSGELDCGRNG